MSKRQRMIQRNKDRRETECRTLLAGLFDAAELASLSPSDAVTLGMQYRREMDAERKEQSARDREARRRADVQRAKARRDRDNYRRECSEKKLQAVS